MAMLTERLNCISSRRTSCVRILSANSCRLVPKSSTPITTEALSPGRPVYEMLSPTRDGITSYGNGYVLTLQKQNSS